MKLSDGSTKLMRPHEIVCNQSKAVELNAPRYDLNGALFQFLIGLIQTTMAPKDDRCWKDNISSIPSEDEVKKAFSTVSHCFNLFGDSYRFMQDISLPDELKDNADGKSKNNGINEKSIDRLLIGAPSDLSLDENKDLFIKRKSIKSVCPSCAAMLLFTLMTNGSTLGGGHLSGLRGSGPLTTIVEGNNIQQTIWLNVLPKNVFFGSNNHNCEENLIFPWLKDSHSEKLGNINVNEVSKLQIFWATNLRIYLNLNSESEDGKICDLCGSSTKHTVSNFYTKRSGYGYNSNEWSKFHTLSPARNYSKDTCKAVILTSKGLSYKDWIGFVQNEPDKDDVKNEFRAAQVVTHIYSVGTKMNNLKIPFRLHSFGFQFDNKTKAKYWYESKMPLYVSDLKTINNFLSHAMDIVSASSMIEKWIQKSVREAKFREIKQGPSSSDSKRNNGDLVSVRMQFWSDTEDLFYQTMDNIFKSMSSIDDIKKVKCKWRKDIEDKSIKIFDENTGYPDIQINSIKSAVSARKKLKNELWSKKLFKKIHIDKEVCSKYGKEVNNGL